MTDSKLNQEKNKGKSRLILILIIVIAGFAIGFGIWFIEFRPFVSTEDARIDVNIVNVANLGAGGQIKEIYVKEGDEVTQGTLLLELDHEMADIQYDRAKAKDELAMNNFVREQALLRESAVTKQLFDSARYDYSAAHADFRQSEIELDRTFMKSPSDGIIVLKNAIVGNILNSGQTAFMIADIKHAWVSANISEKLIDLVKPGQHVDIFIDQYGGRKFSGNVESIGSVANSIFSLLPISTGSTFTKVIQYIQVKINIDAEDINLIPGENVTVTIRVR